MPNRKSSIIYTHTKGNIKLVLTYESDSHELPRNGKRKKAIIQGISPGLSVKQMTPSKSKMAAFV